jgi:Zn-dependent protease with chaperone function
VNAFLGLPALVGISAAVTAWRVSKRSRPDIAVRVLSASFVLMAIAIFAAGALYGVAWMVPAEQAHWCSRVLGHSVDHRPVAGAIVLLMLMLLAGRAFVVGRRVTRVWSAEAVGRPRISIERSDALYAFSVPPTSGSRGSVVVPTSMLGALTNEEQDALFAHEHAHLRFRHHRYLLVGRVLEGVVPFIRPLTRRVYWLLERWADEAAAREVGDRNIVATAIAHAALSASGRPTPALLGFGSDSVVDRVEALFEPLAPPSPMVNLILGLCVLATGAATTTQIHHLAELFGHMTG